MLIYFAGVALLLLFVGILLGTYIFQHRAVFAPRFYRDEELAHAYPSQMHAVELITDENVRLEGIVYEPENPDASTILYFGGREQDSVASIYRFAAAMPHVRWITFNYRGYGQSGDKPTEKKLLKDALKTMEMVEQRYGKPSVMGFSLGASIAAYTASRRPCEKLFMVAGFDSIASMAKARYHFIIPFLIRYRFNTAEYVKRVNVPTYLFASIDDKIIPIAHTRALKIEIKKLAEYNEYTGYDHNSLLLSEGVMKTIEKAVSR